VIAMCKYCQSMRTKTIKTPRGIKTVCASCGYVYKHLVPKHYDNTEEILEKMMGD